MANLPYIPINISDYLADTWHLDTTSHGAYLLLIMNYWQTEKPLPENRIQGITRLDNERYNSVMGTLKEFFNEDENGDWFHERIERDLAAIKKKSKLASDAGKRSAQKRWGAKDVDSIDLDGVPIEDPQQKSNGRVTNKNKTKNKTKSNNIPFDDFWAIYPKSSDKKKARIKWDKISSDDKEKIMLYLPKKILDPDWSDPKFILHPTTFLNGARWEDDISPAKQSNQAHPTQSSGAFAK
tara:strand:- start:53 stop:769 length:717 start_codon:yes stop_codon:yes gene_type:complete